MRYFYAGLIVLITAAVLVLMGQNLGSVTVSFFTVQITMPLFLLKVLIYFLGMVSGGSLVGFVRSLYRRATQSGTSERPTSPT